ncbi:hypothetical protein [Marinitoga aeolica]|uniref:Thioredoxin domain-containing protein n=1 Tax=Marinitoga aeolica TaxID=2809031 RepID=A0ABY8PPA6_9BACT|nr:hypothetical protein [Marinitoga aeolica]WGS64421.1 hypothetical protein JRV97_08565 [Marinitoga aeolica]
MKKMIFLILLFIPIFIYASFSVSLENVVPGMMQTLFVPIELHNNSSELLVYPSLENIRFGRIYIANSYYNVIIGISNGKEIAIVDSNRNKNFTDDYSSNKIIRYDENTPVILSKLYIISNGNSEPYYIIIKKCQDKWGFFGITRKEGLVDLNGEKYKLFISETNSDGIFDLNNFIAGIDLNNDGIFESYEIFNKYFQIDRESYIVTSISSNGDELTFEKTNENIINPVVNSDIPEDILYSNKELKIEKGKWKILVSGIFNDEIKTVLAYLNHINIKNVEIQYMYLYNKNCCNGSYTDVLNNIKNTYPNIKIIPINMENEFDEIQQKMKVLLPKTFMIISPKNKLIYSTKVILDQENLIWNIINPSFAEQFNNLKNFIENIIM